MRLQLCRICEALDLFCAGFIEAELRRIYFFVFNYLFEALDLNPCEALDLFCAEFECGFNYAGFVKPWIYFAPDLFFCAEFECGFNYAGFVKPWIYFAPDLLKQNYAGFIFLSSIICLKPWI